MTCFPTKEIDNKANWPCPWSDWRGTWGVCPACDCTWLIQKRLITEEIDNKANWPCPWSDWRGTWGVCPACDCTWPGSCSGSAESDPPPSWTPEAPQSQICCPSARSWSAYCCPLSYKHTHARTHERTHAWTCAHTHTHRVSNQFHSWTFKS